MSCVRVDHGTWPHTWRRRPGAGGDGGCRETRGRLTDTANLNRFTRTARAFCGNNGLERRGRLTRRVRELLDDPRELNWFETFERWRIYLDFLVTGERPFAGADGNDMTVTVLA